VSSFSGTNLANGQSSDPALQLAPVGNDGPDFSLLKKSFDDTMTNLQGFFDQCTENYNTRYALWSGQSSDGTKHQREGSKTTPTPWEGASDLQVFLTDEAINSKVAMKCLAFRKANIVAVPVEGNDLKRAKTVANFMRWLVQTQIPEVEREVELLENYLEETGVAAVGSFWEETQEKILTTVTLEQMQQQFPQLNMMELIFAEEAADSIVAIFEEIYGCTRAKAKKMLGELRQNQTATVPTLGRKKSRPVIRAFNLNQNLFIPHFSTDMENTPAIFRVEHYTPEQLRAFANTSGWDKNWVEGAIERCRGVNVTLNENEYNQPNSRSFMYQDNKQTDLVAVVFAYQRLSDEDGNTGLYLTILNPHLPPDELQDGYAKYGLLGYAHGQYPFVLFRREFLSRRLHDTRGIPEPGKPIQRQIKVHKDSLIDAASLAICPPLLYPAGRPPVVWGAGARVPERRANEYHYADRPAFDPSTEKSEAQLRADFNQYNGFVSRETDPTFASVKNQNDVDKFMACWSKVFRQIWSLYKQYGSPQVYFRVSGLRELDPVEFNKGDENEEFDFILKFSVDSLDPEQVFAKIEQIAKIVATADRAGTVNYAEWLQAMIESVDPTVAERILDPKEVGQARVVGEMQELLAKVYAGQDQDVKEGTPPELGMQIIQNYVQNDPVVQSRIQNQQDPFGKRIEKLMKQLNMVVMQRENARIGRIGA